VRKKPIQAIAKPSIRTLRLITTILPKFEEEEMELEL